MKGRFEICAEMVFINSYVVSNFDYCSLAQMLSNSESLEKIEGLHKRTLQFQSTSIFRLHMKFYLWKRRKLQWMSTECQLCMLKFTSLSMIFVHKLWIIFKNLKENKRLVYTPLKDSIYEFFSGTYFPTFGLNLSNLSNPLQTYRQIET